uniref:Uncharacterized protein n=1 Tax=Rhizophora mucronata TaxID=61149 RepID=A0A2P2QQF3_RHIMU
MNNVARNARRNSILKVNNRVSTNMKV